MNGHTSTAGSRKYNNGDTKIYADLYIVKSNFFSES